VRHIPAAVGPCLLCTTGFWLVLELRQLRNVRRGARTADRGSIVVLRWAAVAGFLAAAGVARAAPEAAMRPVDVTAWIGLAVLWCGIALRVSSFRALGRYFTFTVQTSRDQPVISTGPYRVLRHPAYAGLLLALGGLGILTTENWLSVLILATAVVSGLIDRITVEERALIHDLGDGYRSYAATHKRLIPFIW
jgi:protein-S-isoprenylcysteine O-methyltransferase Ste14